MMLGVIGRGVVSQERAMVKIWLVSGNGEQTRCGGEEGVVAILWRGAVFGRVCYHIDPVRKEYLAVKSKVDIFAPEIFFSG